MTPILASNFGDLAAASLVGGGLLVATTISLLSLLLVCPKRWRRKGQWHGWLALGFALIFLAGASYLMTTLQRALLWQDVWLFFLLCVPAALAIASLQMSRKKGPE